MARPPTPSREELQNAAAALVPRPFPEQEKLGRFALAALAAMDERDRAVERATQAAADLRRYGDHDDNCPWDDNDDGLCDCGWDAVLARYTEHSEEQTP